MVSISLDLFSLLAHLISFVLLIAALNYCLYRPILKILAERRELFDRLKDKAAKAKSELDSGEAEKTRLNAESLRQALNLKNDLTAKAAAQEKNILAEAQEQTLRQVSESRARLTNSASAARAALTHEVQNIAKDIAGKILGRDLCNVTLLKK
ncbi:MAG: ATP synthase F0 subunit B [Candidatus Adiutrix sp.]|jgi:F-type H+-transporting ATPase subunit b|nr:ATP synthase F0 subunit B [Candidatus Adiutrix sp.]